MDVLSRKPTNNKVHSESVFVFNIIIKLIYICCNWFRLVNKTWKLNNGCTYWRFVNLSFNKKKRTKFTFSFTLSLVSNVQDSYTHSIWTHQQQNDFSFQFYYVSSDVMAKHVMYQAVDTNGFSRESCCFSHHSAHHSNQKDRRIHLDACFIVLPFWD